jgi:cytoskeleton protein RodZ
MTEHETQAGAYTADLSAGQWLAQVRKEHNLTVADVSARLRLAPRQIEAIEADDYRRLPGRTIVRGFVRNYARLLQLDPAQVVAAYDKTDPDDGDQRISVPHQNVQFSEVSSGHQNRSALWSTLGLAILLAIGFIAWRWEAGMGTAPKPATSAVTAPQVTDNGPSAVIPAEPPPVAIESPGAAPPSAGDPAQAAAVPRDIAENVVHLAFEGAARVEVRDAGGKVVWKKTNPAGSEQDITAPLPLTFIIGNAGKVKMTHNGDAFDLTPHIKGSIARFKLER